jgi:hypothetical protein
MSQIQGRAESVQWWLALRERVQGPGWYYNFGNAFGLATGILLHFATAPQPQASAADSIEMLIAYLAGGPSAMLLTVAMIIFFWSGECYHRAWSSANPPDVSLNKQGDVLSGWGALALGLGLLILNQPVLALTAGLLHAAGKFGSAYLINKPPLWPAQWPDCWRTLVLLSRLPALMAVVLELSRIDMHSAAATDVLAPVWILICYLLWLRADILLYGSKH